MFRTELTEAFEAEYPFMNAGMGNVAWGDLAGAVAAAGGIGVIGATGMTGDQLHEEIDRARARAEGPLIVDIVFPVRAPEGRDDTPIPEYIPSPIEQLREELEERGADVPGFDETDVNTFSKEQARELLEVAVDREVDGLATAVGSPEWAIREAHQAGMTVISLAGRPRHAVYAEEAGTDFVVADGTEGGGHSGPVSLLELIPGIQAATDLPVIAAGGISTGAQILAALSCGAEGVWMGTRFIPTEEAAAPDGHKRKVLANERPQDTLRSELSDGFYVRLLQSRSTEVWEGHEDEIQDFPEQAVLTEPIKEAAAQIEAEDYQLYSAGMGSALIDESEGFRPAGEVFAQLVAETEAAYERLTGLHRG